MRLRTGNLQSGGVGPLCFTAAALVVDLVQIDKDHRYAFADIPIAKIVLKPAAHKNAHKITASAGSAG